MPAGVKTYTDPYDRRGKLKEIGPYDDSIFQQKMADLVQEPGFLHAISYTMPREEMPPLIEELKK